jgi:hypothetical protein
MLGLSVWFYSSYAALWLLTAVVAIAVILLYRHFGLMILGTLEGVERDGLNLGEEVPELSGALPSGANIKWKPVHGRSTLILFAAPNCGPCEEVMPWINHLHFVSAGRSLLDVVVLVRGPAENAQAIENSFQPQYLVFSEDGSGAYEVCRVRVTPFAFVVGNDGRLRSKGLCGDPFRLKRLLVAAALEDIAELLEPALVDLREQADIARGNGTTPPQAEVLTGGSR